jgi:transposase
MLISTGIKEMIYNDKFEDIYIRWRGEELSCEEASELLHCSIKTFYRKRQDYEENGLFGVLDRRIGNSPPNKIPSDKITEILSLRKEYPDYNMRHLQYELDLSHKLRTSYSSLRRILYMNGMFKIGRKPRKKHRKRRKPRPMTGMMIHQDGSTHNWLPDTDIQHDLIITMDDANNEVYSAFLCDEEGTFSSFRGISDVIKQKGLFNTFYVDRGSHYGYTPKAGGNVDLSRPTQVARALKQLGTHVIYSKCPQGRGRGERLFRTWQGRLPQELAKQNITDIDKANDYIKKVFLPKMNKQYMR